MASGRGYLVDFGLAQPLRLWSRRHELLTQRRQLRKRAAPEEAASETSSMASSSSASSSASIVASSSSAVSSASASISSSAYAQTPASDLTSRPVVGLVGVRGGTQSRRLAQAREAMPAASAQARPEVLQSLERRPELSWALPRRPDRAGTPGFRAPEVPSLSLSQSPPPAHSPLI